MKKIYLVTFNKYTNYARDTVSGYIDGEYKYIDSLDDGSMLCYEDDIDYLMNFGEGINTMKFVGHLYERQK